jgi:hypothetical protein
MYVLVLLLQEQKGKYITARYIDGVKYHNSVCLLIFKLLYAFSDASSYRIAAVSLAFLLIGE